MSGQASDRESLTTTLSACLASETWISRCLIQGQLYLYWARGSRVSVRPRNEQRPLLL